MKLPTSEKPTAIELALVAAAMAPRDATGAILPHEIWQRFSKAEQVINEARSFLTRNPEQAGAIMNVGVGYARSIEEFERAGCKAISFTELLSPKEAPTAGSKKVRTLLGDITTGRGLCNAIRAESKTGRITTKDASEFITQKAIPIAVAKRLMERKQEAAKRRTETRRAGARKARQAKVEIK